MLSRSALFFQNIFLRELRKKILKKIKTLESSIVSIPDMRNKVLQVKKNPKKNTSTSQDFCVFVSLSC